MNDLADIENLIARAGIGERAAFSDLYERTSAKLFGVCLRVLNDRAAAEDAMQDAYVKIWKNADRYSANGLSPMTWLITIARNTAIDRLRARRDTEDYADYSDTLPAGGLTPEGAAIAGSEARRIAGCMEELAEDRRSAVRDCYLGGLSYADLADKFDVPLNTMRTWLRRSLAALRECMAR
ncbi:MAG: sigma-70 family RNA polymerase sigma factor [Silicimonas sp.]|nr:sigma-70 family RNA polymerase sigma factor [Silicimonas sp.]